ncbi:MAG: hypothetical protein V2A58_12915 [Planctomycetota bacterium]
MSEKHENTPCVEDENGAVPEHSLYAGGREEALKHKWIESEKMGHDLGQRAIEDWNRRHWWKWCRGRWVEHLQGELYWKELGPASFGVLKRHLSADPVLQDRVVDRIKAGWENLDIILWATRWGLDVNAVHELLTALDMNSCRFAPCDDAEGS